MKTQPEEAAAREALTKTILGAMPGLSVAQLRRIEYEAEALRIDQMPPASHGESS